MNRIKSIYIALYPAFLIVVSGIALKHLFTTGIDYIWLGALLTTLPMLLFFSRIMIFQNTPRTSKRFPLLTIIALTGLILALRNYFILADDLKSDSETAFLMAMTGYLTFVIYTYWYSSFSRGNNQQIKAGKKLVNFPLTDVNGNTVSSDIFKGSPTILLFFRGNWCPLCMAQIKEIAEKYQQLSALGARVALISPQPETHTSKLASKFKVDMEFYSDNNNQAAKILNIEMKNGLPTGMQVLGYDSDTVLPTVIIIDKEGTILYNDATENYRVRPEPEAFIKILQQSKAEI
jgi:peroxiredoxin